MTPEMLLENFDVIADAPNGVQRLRELILQLAVRGELVPFDPSCVAQPFGNILGEASLNGIPTKPHDEAVGTPILRISAGTSRRDATVEESDHKYLNVDAATVEKFRLRPGDLLACRFNGNLHYVGRVSLYTGMLGITQIYPDKLIRFRVDTRFCDPAYVRYAFNAPDTRQKIESFCATTAGNIGISAGNLKLIEIPIPPLAEQRRIVAKIDELMALCDHLEERQQRRCDARARLNRSTLHRLTSAADDAELAEQWQRVCENFDVVYQTQEIIAELRQAILQLAVRGKLVRQDPNDEPASALVERIAAEKQRLSYEGRIGTRNSLATVNDHDVPFQVPEQWVWGVLDQLFTTITDGDHQPPPRAEAGIPFLVIGNVSSGRIDFTNTRFVPRRYYDGLDESRRPVAGDLLYTVTGSYGLAVAVDENRPFCVQRHIAILKSANGSHTAFLRYLLRSKFVFDQATDRATGIAQKTVSLGALRSILVPIPPAAEQERIVAKVNELMALCDRLQAHLTRAREKSEHLAASIVHHLTAA